MKNDKTDSIRTELQEEALEIGREARDRFMSDLNTLSEHAQELLRVTGEMSGQGVAAAREQLSQSLGTITESLRRWQDEALSTGRRFAERTDTYVHENPWPAIGAGVLVGVALGVAGGSLARGTGNGNGNGNARH